MFGKAKTTLVLPRWYSRAPSKTLEPQQTGKSHPPKPWHATPNFVADLLLKHKRFSFNLQSAHLLMQTLLRLNKNIVNARIFSTKLSKLCT